MRLLTAVAATLLLLGSAPLHAQDSAPSDAKSSPIAAPSSPIPLASPDRQIAERLVRLYRALGGLDHVRVTVRDGVVTLAGTTLDGKDRLRAEELAARVAGVVSVRNDLRSETRVSARLTPLVDKTAELGRTLLQLIPLLIVAVLAFAGFWIAGRYFTRSTRLFKRLAPNEFIEALIEQLVRLAFILAGLVTAMSILGATALLGSVLGAAGVLGLAVGFAVRDTIENYIASILLSVRQPFRPNDSVLIEGFEGRITRLNSRATILTTGDGNEVRIPNATVYKANIVNYSHNPERRFGFEIGIVLDSDLCLALAIGLKAVRATEGVLAYPEPTVLADRIEPHGVILAVTGWTDQTRSNFDKVRSEAIRAVIEAFDEAGLALAEPIQNQRPLPPRDAGAGKPVAVPKAELAAITDTRADRTEEKRVHAIRAEGHEDLLAHAGPRE